MTISSTVTPVSVSSMMSLNVNVSVVDNMWMGIFLDVLMMFMQVLVMRDDFVDVFVGWVSIMLGLMVLVNVLLISIGFVSIVLM